MSLKHISIVLVALITISVLGFLSTGYARAELFDDYQRYIKIRMLMFKVMNLAPGTPPVAGGGNTTPTPTPPRTPVNSVIVDSSTNKSYGEAQYLPGQGTTITIRYQTDLAIPADKALFAWLERPDKTWVKLGILGGPAQGNIYAVRYSDLGNMIGLRIIITQEIKTPEPAAPDTTQVIVNLIQQIITPTPTP